MAPLASLRINTKQAHQQQISRYLQQQPQPQQQPQQQPQAEQEQTLAAESATNAQTVPEQTNERAVADEHQNSQKYQSDEVEPQTQQRDEQLPLQQFDEPQQQQPLQQIDEQQQQQQQQQQNNQPQNTQDFDQDQPQPQPHLHNQRTTLNHDNNNNNNNNNTENTTTTNNIDTSAIHVLRKAPEAENWANKPSVTEGDPESLGETVSGKPPLQSNSQRAWIFRASDAVSEWVRRRQWRDGTPLDESKETLLKQHGVIAEIRNSGLGAVLMVTVAPGHEITLRPNSIISMSNDFSIVRRVAIGGMGLVGAARRYMLGAFPILLQASNKTKHPCHIVLGPSHLSDVCLFNVTSSDSLHISPTSYLASASGVTLRAVSHVSYPQDVQVSPVRLRCVLASGNGFVAMEAGGGLVTYQLKRGERVAFMSSQLACWTTDIHFEPHSPKKAKRSLRNRFFGTSLAGDASGTSVLLTAMGPGLLGLYTRAPGRMRLELLREEREIGRAEEGEVAPQPLPLRIWSELLRITRQIVFGPRHVSVVPLRLAQTPAAATKENENAKQESLAASENETQQASPNDVKQVEQQIHDSLHQQQKDETGKQKDATQR